MTSKVLGQGKDDDEFGAFRGAVMDRNPSVVIFDNLPGNGQTQAGTVVTGGKKGLENFIEDLLLNAVAFVSHGQDERGFAFAVVLFPGRDG